MPQVNRNRHAFALIVLCIAMMMAGCGKSNSQAPFSPDTGRHNGNWSDPQAIGSARFHATAIIEVSGSEGAVLFAKRCAVCHGNSGAGKLAPNILNETAAFISAAINVVPLMRGQSDLDLNQIQAIADYIAALSGGAAPVTRVINTSNCQGCHGSGLNGGIAVVSCFSCHNGPSGDIGHPAGFRPPNTDSPVFHGNFGNRFRASCTTCHGLDFKGGIGPSCTICHDGTVAPVLDFIPVAQPGAVVNIFTALSGDQEVPAVATAGSGTASLTINTGTGAISGTVTFTGLTSNATFAHIHHGVAGTNGDVVVALTGGEGATAGTWTIPGGANLGDQLGPLVDDELYINIHSATNPAGEIRGQIIYTGITIITALSGAQEVPPVATGATATANLTVNIATGAISGTVTFTGLTSNATAAHIHQAAAGVNGPVIVPMTGGAGATAGTWTIPAGSVLTPAQLTALQADGLYFNIHSAANLGGEIRGQILFP